MKVDKPWGHEIRWAINDKYLGKLLFVKQGNRLSKQYHKVKDETIYVLEGELMLELGPHMSVPDQESIREVVKQGESRRIHPGVIHRFCAEKGDVVLIEVSTPEIDDVVRLQDDYKRVPGTEIEEDALYAVYGGD